MKLKVLFDDSYRILATMESGNCPVEEFLEGDDSACAGLRAILETVAEMGLAEVPRAWFHEVNKQSKIYEFIKGDFRLFFFKGQGRDIAVCVHVGRKQRQKVDPRAVTQAASARATYVKAVEAGTLEVIDETE